MAHGWRRGRVPEGVSLRAWRCHVEHQYRAAEKEFTQQDDQQPLPATCHSSVSTCSDVAIIFKVGETTEENATLPTGMRLAVVGVAGMDS